MGLGTIKQILMERDGLSDEEADDLIAEAKQALLDYLDNDDQLSAQEVCEEFFGLEPDYLMELMPM